MLITTSLLAAAPFVLKQLSYFCSKDCQQLLSFCVVAMLRNVSRYKWLILIMYTAQVKHCLEAKHEK
jgi:hypothetical protein